MHLYSALLCIAGHPKQSCGGSLLNHHQCAASTWMIKSTPHFFRMMSFVKMYAFYKGEAERSNNNVRYMWEIMLFFVQTSSCWSVIINIIRAFFLFSVWSAPLMEKPWSQSPALRSSMAQSIQPMGKSSVGQRYLTSIHCSSSFNLMNSIVMIFKSVGLSFFFWTQNKIFWKKKHFVRTMNFSGIRCNFGLI